ncbi:hypothetical protein ACFB49_25040 [Sphingomonas sp. DBB INV C78]|uniref:HEPN domain-containing protein n=1 Tax=Sphingomonas sp. DBB INV C78 TaxID=3349434 RepID=UPI0036D29A96
MDIMRDGISLSGVPGVAFLKPAPLSPEQALKETQDYFEEWFESADEFYDDFRSNLEKGRFKKAAFELHQATERYYHCLFLVRTLYSPKTHNLNRLRQQAEGLEPSLKAVWPTETKFQKRCYELLRAAYVTSISAEVPQFCNVEAVRVEFRTRCRVFSRLRILFGDLNRPGKTMSGVP